MKNRRMHLSEQDMMQRLDLEMPQCLATSVSAKAAFTAIKSVPYQIDTLQAFTLLSYIHILLYNK